MQVNDKLKPCPFCGGKAEIQVGEYTSFVDGYAVRCGNCSLTFGACGRIGETYCWSCCFETVDEAIEAWNTRAEDDKPEPGIITCEFDSNDFGKRRCKRCGAFVSVDSVWDCFSCIPVRYCPNCGAKVISNAD